nr:DNA-directed DNA polymerase [Tanacetum cinerariifolium]
FLLEEVDAFLAVEDEPTSSDFYQPYLDLEGDILLSEAFLNDDPSLPPLNQRNYLTEVRKELKICEAHSEKSSVDEPSVAELKELPPHLEYAFLEGDDKLPVIIAKDLSMEEKTALITILKPHKRAITWKLSDIKGINPEFYTHKILMEEDFEPAVQHQRMVNPKIHDVIKQEGWFTVVENEDNELIPTRLVTGCRVCIDYRKLNEATRKDHFPLPFMDQMLERLVGNQYYCFLDGFLVIFKFPSIPRIRRKPHSPAHTERLLIVACLLGYAMLQACFKGIVLGHKISKQGIEVDKAKVDVITKLPHPTTVKGIRSFLGHAGFYRRFIKDFSKIARPMTRLLERDAPFIFSLECVDAFRTLKTKLCEAPILIAPNWDMPFELMCDASDLAIGAVLGQRQDKHFRLIYYASKTMTEAESKYTMTEKEMSVVVRCVSGQEVIDILNACHSGPTGDSYRMILSSKSSFPQLQLGIIAASLGERPGEAWCCSGFIDSIEERTQVWFVRFKNIEDVELLHQRLRRIQIRNEYLRVYVAYDRHEKTTKSIVGEVRAIEYLEKLSQICEKKDLDHGLRRWIHKLRLWDEKYRTVGRLTWISIMGVPIMCWKESVFSNIAKWHGNVIEFSN